MPGPNTKLTAAVEAYFAHLRSIRASGGATDERSYYPPLSNLLDAVGSTLRPKVFCVTELAQQGAGHPDVGLYASHQRQKGKIKQGQGPERGVMEVKPAGDDAWLTADSAQVSQYWDHYRLVLLTNTHDFVLLGEDAQGQPTKLEIFRLAGSAGVPPGRALGDRPGGVRSLVPGVVGVAEVPGEGALMSLRVSWRPGRVEARNCPAWGRGNGSESGPGCFLGMLCFHSRSAHSGWFPALGFLLLELN